MFLSLYNSRNVVVAAAAAGVVFVVVVVVARVRFHGIRIIRILRIRILYEIIFFSFVV